MELNHISGPLFDQCSQLSLDFNQTVDPQPPLDISDVSNTDNAVYGAATALMPFGPLPSYSDYDMIVNNTGPSFVSLLRMTHSLYN